MKTNESFSISYEEAKGKLKMNDSDLIKLSQYGNLTFDIYKPKGVDKQLLHDKDEIYMVISGKGTLNCDQKRTNCNQGDIVFVPAGTEHHFENFSSDFCAWAVFSNPTGAKN